jgi:GNAT superfamily N-acetyltransferase
MSDITIREGRGPEEHALYAGFIDALQAYEHAMEPDRRIDPRAGADYLPVLLTRVKEHDGKIFVAEIDGRPVGWAVFHCDDGANYLVPEERRSGLVVELYLEEAARGRGLGQALIAACEEAARALGLKRLLIGVLSANMRARTAYERAGFAPYTQELRKYL